MSTVWTLVQIALIGLLGTIIVAALLALLPRRAYQRPTRGGGLAFPEARGGYSSPAEAAVMRDGTRMPYRKFAAPHGPLLVMVHGSGWHGYQFAALGQKIAEAGLATCLAIDIRGHGEAPARRGDCDYIGQLEDDIADLTLAEAEGRPVVLLGHSSGGGLVIRYAGGRHGIDLAGAILLAPFIHHKSPTQRANSGGWADPFLRRLIGLSILNSLRIRVLNGLEVIRFNFPDTVLAGPLGHTATAGYSYRLNTSYAPRWDFRRDIASLPKFLLLAGDGDEAFIPEAYEPLFKEAGTMGQVVLIPGAGHLDVVDHEQSFARIAEYLQAWHEH